MLHDTNNVTYLRVGLVTSTAHARNAAVAVNIGTTANVHAISPLIYGVAFATTAQLQALNAPLNRSGGNNTSTTNYYNNAQNLDADYYFESYPQTGSRPGAEPDAFVDSTKKAGAAPLLTVPLIGWTAKLGAGRAILPSFSVAKYGPQCGTDPYFPVPAKEQNGVPYIPWLLSQWKAAGHPVDVLSVHFYPQGAEFSNDVSTATQL